MCIECDDGGVSRRAFLSGAAAAVAGAAVSAEASGRGQGRALDDVSLAQGGVTFRSGADSVEAYLARPRARGRRRAVLVLHGNAGLPEDIRNTAAQLARAGYVGLAVSSTSREPDPSVITREFVSSNRYIKRYVRDAQAGIDYLKAQPFVRGGRVGVVGFCGGGITAVMLAAGSEDVAAVVALYAAPFFTPERNSPTDPRPDMITFVEKLTVPVQCHFGAEDALITAADVERFRRELRKHRVRSEVYVYEGAGHAFYDYTRAGYRPGAAELSRRRMVSFLKRNLT